MFVKNAISIFVGMQSSTLLSLSTVNPYESTRAFIKGKSKYEHDRTLARASLRRKPLPD